MFPPLAFFAPRPSIAVWLRAGRVRLRIFYTTSAGIEAIMGFKDLSKKNVPHVDTPAQAAARAEAAADVKAKADARTAANAAQREGKAQQGAAKPGHAKETKGGPTHT